MRSLRSLVLFVVAIALASILLVTGATIWFAHAVHGDRSLPATSTTVIIPRGSTFSDITRELASQGIIANPTAFRLLARLRHEDSEVRAGEYRFAPHQSESQILQQLLHGGAQVAVWVTIPEGFTAREIADRLSEAGLGRSEVLYARFMHGSIVLGGVRTNSLEGYLFPSTYLLPIGATPGVIADALTAQFRKELPRDARAAAARLHLSIVQVVVVASLVEREAKIDSERALMAGVYYNRLRLGMPLQVDATLEYALPEHKTVLTEADVQRESPYNTYKHSGLPPTPIANPGEASLNAAFHPKFSPYLYYLSKPDGHSVFAKTLAEHNANVARYLK
ncbi:MAG: endolytic transglycosylase MltG [Candidatus Eremiobacteraeota bacterium]|nr:endolytic transglycosylase MltG [Candidatus Eremiobacteraeota bacterium]